MKKISNKCIIYVCKNGPFYPDSPLESSVVSDADQIHPLEKKNPTTEISNNNNKTTTLLIKKKRKKSHTPHFFPRVRPLRVSFLLLSPTTTILLYILLQAASDDDDMGKVLVDR